MRRPLPAGHDGWSVPIDESAPLDVIVKGTTGEAVLRISTLPGIVSDAYLLDAEALEFVAGKMLEAAHHVCRIEAAH